MSAYLIRRVIVGLLVIAYALETLGYWIRPYDMLADARRWFWVPQTCCRCGRPAWPWTHRRVRTGRTG